MHEGARGYEFGPFQLDCLNHRVLRDGRPVPLTPKAIDTLQFLIEHRDRVLGKDELLKALWPDSFVEEANLAQHVFTLRKTLGTQPNGAPYIETIPKRGYRFAADATEIPSSVAVRLPDSPPTIEVESRRPARFNVVRWGALAAGLVLVVALSTVYVRAVRKQRLMTSVIGSVETAVAANNFDAAHATLAAAGIDPGDPKLAAITDRIAGSISVSTDPATSVRARRLDLAQRTSNVDLIDLGQTPMTGRRLVAGEYVIELTGSGVVPIRMLVNITPGNDLRVERALLSSSGSSEDMVSVEAGETRWMDRVVSVPAFSIDSHEVTNTAFQQFVEAGKYHDPSLWPQTLTVDGQPVPFARAMARFVDRTGLPGPRTWSDGRYPEGKGDHPVVGVSWYEATAYAKWKGMQLPSFEEWRRAAVNGAESGFPWGSDVKTAELRANFSLLGTTPVDAHPGGLSPFGCTDMAGNAREWLRDELGTRHPAAGGSWLEPSYDFEHAEWFDAAQASPGIGFRLMSRTRENEEKETATLLPPPGSVPEHASNDAWIRRPANNQEFETLSKFLAYDARLPFDVKLIDVKNDAGVIVEHLTFQSSPGTRVSTLMMHAGETSGRPGIILLHSAGAKGKDLPNNISLGLSMARAGWSVIAIDLPYFGERATELLTAYSDEEKHAQLYNQPGVYLGWLTQAVRDTRRAFDLLIERTGADPNRVALVGASRGAIVGLSAAGVDKRFSPVVLLFGGHATPLELEHLEPACPANYIGRIAPRPLLMLNSVNDQTFPPDTAVRPLFALAGKPKEIIWTDTGHMVLTEEDIARVMGWLRSKLN